MKPFKVPGIKFSWRHDGQDHPPRDPYRSDWRVHHPPLEKTDGLILRPVPAFGWAPVIITNGNYKRDSGLQCPLTTYQKMQLCLALSKNSENRRNLAYVFDYQRGPFKNQYQKGAAPGRVLPDITYTGMCRPTESWFWNSWFRTG